MAKSFRFSGTGYKPGPWSTIILDNNLIYLFYLHFIYLFPEHQPAALKPAGAP
jgi:hypothetical protein